MKKVESTVSAWPQTKVLDKEGGVQITGRYHAVEPLHKGFQKGLLVWLIFSVLLLGFFVHVIGELPKIDLGIGLVIFALFPALWIVHLMQETQKRDLDIRIFPDSIEIRGKSYERDMRRIEFRVEPHSRAAQEEANEIRAQKRGSRRYREALEVVMQYGEKRIPIAGMKQRDKDNAVALMFRLQDWSERFDHAIQDIKQGGPVPAVPGAAASFKPVAELR